MSEAQYDVTQRTDWHVPDDPRLPHVLLLGDSISIGYTHAVRQALHGRANVHRAIETPTSAANCRATAMTLPQLDRWLGVKPWDVIHCNWGLHDLARIGQDGDVPQLRVPLAEYEQNLERIIARLKRTGAKLIYATTTPVPDGVTNRADADVRRYNEAARKVMRRHDVRVNDLYAFALPRLGELQKPANVHFHEHGSAVLGEEVARIILDVLSKQAGDIATCLPTIQRLPSTPILFLDDRYIARAEGIRRVVHQPTKHPHNPVMVRDQPWEARVIEVYGTVLYDDARRIFRCWYLANEQKKDAVPDTPEAKALAKYYQCYAESEDGVHWRKPPVGHGNFGPYDRHNMVIPDGHGFCVLHTPDDPDPNRIFKGGGGAIVGFSPDGIKWSVGDWRPAVGKNDTGTSIVRWNDQYFAYVRYQITDPIWPGVMRGIGLCTSDDFQNWSAKELIFRTDEQDGYPWTQPYGLSVTPYGDQLIGLLWMLRLDRNENNNRLGDMDVELVVSRDGRNWKRVADRQVFLAPSAGTWDAGRVIPSTTMVVKDDQIYIYYTGADTRHGEQWGAPAIGLATLPADRFVAICAAGRSGEPGVLQTTPFLAHGSSLLVNAEMSASQDLQIELLDGRGDVLEGFSRQESRLTPHDALRYRVSWHDRSGERHFGDLAADQAVAFRFIVTGDSMLYSFQVRP